MADPLAELEAMRGDFRAFSANIAELTRTIEQHGVGSGHTQTIIHKSSTGGFVTGIAVAACIGSFFFTMYLARTLDNKMRDMSAWVDVLRGKISMLEGKQH